MQAVRRLAGGDPGMITDAGIAIAGAGLTAVAAWDPAGLAGTAIAGPPWLLVLLPLLMGARAGAAPPRAAADVDWRYGRA